MKEKIREIIVSSAYRIENHAETMDADSALAAVHSDKAYHTAIWNDDFSVTLIRSDLICPFCNAVHPIKRHDEIRQWQMDTIKIWENPQLSLFSRGKVQKKLTLFPIELHRFSCLQCGKQSDDENKTTTICMKEQKNKIIVRCEITDLCSIYDLPYLPKNRFSVEFPLYEQIEFNFGNGHTCIRIVTEQDCVLHTVDITNQPLILSGSAFAKWFYGAVKQMLIAAFSETAKADALMEWDDISLENFIFLVRFIGYPKEFYYAIPYDKETYIIDDSFENLDKLHTVETAISYLLNFPLQRRNPYEG